MELKLAFSLNFEDLYSLSGLTTINQEFHNYVKTSNIDLYHKYNDVINNKLLLSPLETSELLITLAPYLENFIAKLFAIETEANNLFKIHDQFRIIAKIKREFVQRRAIKTYPDPSNFNGNQLESALEEIMAEKITELTLAKHINNWLEQNEIEKIDLAAKYCAYASLTKEGKEKYKTSTLFNHPHKLDPFNLIEVVKNHEIKLEEKKLHPREGFKLSDKGANLQFVVDQANYCIFCHNQQKDSCSHGLKDKEGKFKKSELNVTLTGCPLEEKISEMNQVKYQGYSIGALAIVCIDNPMVAATGHRICNDCMKACIYQKQEPVDIPQIETRTLRDVLNLPWGVEIYSLLTRWNPLNFNQQLPRTNSDFKVLVVGSGPAGFTLAHYLLNSGHTVIAIDGLKIEPLPEICKQPIYDAKTLYENLDGRIMSGFGGVTEYGITVRWNKNFLKIIRLLLERRTNFSLIGGIRFGSNLTYEQAFANGFDHIALCLGAGKPNILEIPNSLARGVRTASDFLMALQLTGAAKKDSIANLQIRLPVVVIGGGLTAIDTATEALAYYPVQVEKFLTRIEKIGLENLNLTQEEQQIANEFITHAKELRIEKTKKEPVILKLLNKWGGVKILYRKKLIDSPAYRLNHEEVAKALVEGISLVENIIPVSINLDQFGHTDSIKVRHSQLTDSMEILYPAKTILVATGTTPNTILAKEAPNLFKLDGKYFRAIDENGNQVIAENIAKPEQTYVLTSINDEGKAVSFFGDLHPSFYGNVVKAMASAKKGYPIINKVLSQIKPTPFPHFINKIEEQLTAKVHQVNRLTPNIIEVIVKAPLAALNFKPGQFYRLQNFESYAKKINNTTLAMEGLAMTGAWFDKAQGLIATIILEMGGSSSLCQFLEKDEPIVLMGPTGAPTEIPNNENVMLIGGGLGNAVLFSIGKALKDNHCKTLYFAGYKKPIDRYKISEIEQAADQIIWSCDQELLNTTRSGDLSFKGNIIETIENYAQNYAENLAVIDRIITIGSSSMMQAISYAVQKGPLKNYFKPNVKTIASINSPMQCMMKEICGQCLQKQINLITNEITYVYSCFNQDQCMKNVDFNFLNERLKQNSLQEKLTAKWIEHITFALNYVNPNLIDYK